MASELISVPYALSTTQRVVVAKHRNHFGRKTVTHATAKIHVICGYSTKKEDAQLIGRRSANYQPNLWTYEFLHQSHHNHHVVDKVKKRARKLEEKVRYMMMNSSDMEPLNLLEFIEDLYRLGLSYKFQNHINSALSRIHSSQYMHLHTHKTLHATAILFRILRQHAVHVSQDVFQSFTDDEKNFKPETGNDVQGMLSLYEASHLSFEGENLCEKAKTFSATSLMNIISKDETDTTTFLSYCNI